MINATIISWPIFKVLELEFADEISRFKRVLETIYGIAAWGCTLGQVKAPFSLL